MTLIKYCVPLICCLSLAQVAQAKEVSVFPVITPKGASNPLQAQAAQFQAALLKSLGATDLRARLVTNAKLIAKVTSCSGKKVKPCLGTVTREVPGIALVLRVVQSGSGRRKKTWFNMYAFRKGRPEAVVGQRQVSGSVKQMTDQLKALKELPKSQPEPTQKPAIEPPKPPSSPVAKASPKAVVNTKQPGNTKSGIVGHTKPWSAALALGFGTGQIFSDLKESPTAALDLRYLLPWALPKAQHVGLRTRVGLAQPSGGGELAPDDRLHAPEAVNYQFQQRQLMLDLGLVYRHPITPTLALRAALDFRTWLLETRIDGAVAELAFPSESVETGTSHGWAAGLGLEWAVGPGAFDSEIQLGSALEERTVRHRADPGLFSLLVGYRYGF